jgi:hypothetical protein
MAQTTVAINLEAKTKGTESVKSLKAQIREATNEAVALAQKFGALSPEAIAATKRVAELKDQMEDFNQRVAALNPDKFAAIGTVVKGLAGGIQAAQGAMALFGSESEDVQKALLKVQGAMAFAQGVDQLMQMQNSFGALATKIKGPVIAAFTTLRGALMAVGIGILVAGVAALIANFDKVSDWISKSWFGSLARGIASAFTALTDFIGITSQAERDLEKMSKATTKSNEELGRQIEVLTALGGKEKEVYELKKRQAENELNILRETFKTKGKLTDDEWKQFNDLKNKQKVLTIEYNKFVQGEADKKKKEDEAAAKEAAAKAQENYKKNIENERKALQDLAEERRKQLELNAKDERALADIKYNNDLERLKVAKANDLRQENLTASARKAIQDKYAVLQVSAKIEHDKKIKDLDQKAQDERLKQQEEFENKRKELTEKEISDTVSATDDFYKGEQLKLTQRNADADEFAALELQRLEAQLQNAKDYGQSTVDLELQIAAKKKEIRDKDIEEQKQAELQKIELTKGGFQAIGELVNAFAGSSEEAQRRAFEINKAASIATAIIDTYTAAQGAYKSQMAIATPDAPVRAAVAAGIAIAQGLARVAQIKKTQFQSKDAAGGGAGGGGGVPTAPALAPTVGGGLPDEQQFGGMGRVYVLEGDITKTQTRVRRLRNTSVV